MGNLLEIRALSRKKKITIREIADYCGVTEQGLQKMIRENKIKVEVLMKVATILNEPVETFVDIEAMKKGTGSDEKNTIQYSGGDIPMCRKIDSPGLKSLFFQKHIEVKLVTTKARAGYAGAYYADEYLEDMPTVLIESDKEYHGKYLAFEVDGDSMEPQYTKGDVIICREIKRDLWQYKLHYSDWDFVIAHGTKGIMLKEIIEHNTDTGEIICHSLNQEGGQNPDFILNLKEVAFLYNVVEHRRSGKNTRRNR